MSSRRPLAIYSAKRRQRSISNPHYRPVGPSSPLKQLESQDADLSVVEMSRRMMKRSRSGLSRSGSASTGASPNDPYDEGDGRVRDNRPAKKSRVGCELEDAKATRVPLQTILEPGSNIPADDTGMSVDMDLTSVLQLKTPTPREDTAPMLPGATHIPTRDSEAPDFLSPLPSNHSSKRILAHRASSIQLKENRPRISGAIRSASASNTGNGLLSPAPLSLASPFNSRPGSPSRKRLASRRSSKKGTGKTLNRTRSVGTDLRRKATMRSYSRAVSPDSTGATLNRHPSHPTSLASRKDKEEWFISPRLKQPGLNTSPSTRPQTPTSQVPYGRETSFFSASPQACSTPVPRNRATVLDVPPTPGFLDPDATPRLPLTFQSSAALSFDKKNGDSDSILDGPTPRARPFRTSSALGSLLNAEDSLFPDSDVHDPPRLHDEPNQNPESTAPIDKARRRMTIHLSQDSIFSSAMDLSVSMTAKRPLTSAPSQVGQPSVPAIASTRNSSDPELPVPPSSPAMPVSPASSEGDELRDMFSILGLDGMSSHGPYRAYTDTGSYYERMSSAGIWLATRWSFFQQTVIQPRLAPMLDMPGKIS